MKKQIEAMMVYTSSSQEQASSATNTCKSDSRPALRVFPSDTHPAELIHNTSQVTEVRLGEHWLKHLLNNVLESGLRVAKVPTISIIYLFIAALCGHKEGCDNSV